MSAVQQFFTICSSILIPLPLRWSDAFAFSASNFRNLSCASKKCTILPTQGDNNVFSSSQNLRGFTASYSLTGLRDSVLRAGLVVCAGRACGTQRPTRPDCRRPPPGCPFGGLFQGSIRLSASAAALLAQGVSAAGSGEFPAYRLAHARRQSLSFHR